MHGVIAADVEKSVPLDAHSANTDRARGSTKTLTVIVITRPARRAARSILNEATTALPATVWSELPKSTSGVVMEFTRM